MKVTLNWKLVCSAQRLDDHQWYLEEQGGIYLWIWNGDPRRIVYIGEAGNFSSRLFDHFRNMLTGYYTYFRTMGDKDDFIEIVKEYYAGRKLCEIKQNGYVHVPVNMQLSDCLPDEGELLLRHRYLYGMDFAFAEIVPPQAYMHRKEIEGGLIRDVWDTYCQIASTICLNRSDARPNQKLIGNINKYPTMNFEIEHTGAVNHIPKELLSIKSLARR